MCRCSVFKNDCSVLKNRSDDCFVEFGERLSVTSPFRAGECSENVNASCRSVADVIDVFAECQVLVKSDAKKFCIVTERDRRAIEHERLAVFGAMSPKDDTMCL